VLSYLGGVEPHRHLDDCLLLPDMLGQVVVRFDRNAELPRGPFNLGLLHCAHPKGDERDDHLVNLLERVLPELAHRVEFVLGQALEDQVNVDRVLEDLVLLLRLVVALLRPLRMSGACLRSLLRRAAMPSEARNGLASDVDHVLVDIQLLLEVLQ